MDLWQLFSASQKKLLCLNCNGSDMLSKIIVFYKASTSGLGHGVSFGRLQESAHLELFEAIVPRETMCQRLPAHVDRSRSF